MGSIDPDMGILLAIKYLAKSSLIMRSLNDLLKGPAYDTNAEASKTSPTITFNCSSSPMIDWAHL